MKKTTEPKAPAKRRRTFSQLLALEQRMLFDAAAVATVDAACADQQDATADHDSSHDTSPAESPSGSNAQGSGNSFTITRAPSLDGSDSKAGTDCTTSETGNAASDSSSAESGTPTDDSSTGSDQEQTQSSEVAGDTGYTTAALQDQQGETDPETGSQPAPDEVLLTADSGDTGSDSTDTGSTDDLADTSSGQEPTETTGTPGYSATVLEDQSSDTQTTVQIDVQVTDGKCATSFDLAGCLPNGAKVVADNDRATVMEGDSTSADVAGGLLSNDTGSNLKITMAGVGSAADTALGSCGGIELQGSYGILRLKSDGSYTYTATQDVSGNVQDTFTYQVSDGKNTATATLTVNVENKTTPDANHDPDAGDDNGTVTEGSDLTVAADKGLLANDSDSDQDGLQISRARVDDGDPSGWKSLPASGSEGVTLSGEYGTLALKADGSYSYSADHADAIGAGQRGNDYFVYEVSDGKGGVTTATLTISITGTNDAPIARPDKNSSATENGPTITVAVAQGVILSENSCVRGMDTDVDSDRLQVCGVAAGDGQQDVSGNVGSSVTGKYGSLTLNADGSYSYDPNMPNGIDLKPGEIGKDVFTYRISDGKGGYASSTLTISVTGASDASDSPVATNDSANVAEGKSISADAASGLLSNDTGSPLTIIMAGTGNAADKAMGSCGGIELHGSYGILQLKADGSYTYTATPDVSGDVQDTFTYQVSDGKNTATASLTVTVKDGTVTCNHPPVAMDDSGNIRELQTLSISSDQGLLSNDSDPDGNPLSIVRAGAGTDIMNREMTADGVTLTGSYGILTLKPDGSYTYTSTQDVTGNVQDVFTYQITDGTCTDTATLTINVGNCLCAHPPVAADDTGRVTELQTLTVGGPQGLLSNDSDLDGDSLSIIRAGAGTDIMDKEVTADGVTLTGSYGTLTLKSDGSYIYASTKDVTGDVQDVFTYQITDGTCTDTATLTITVGCNHAPVAGNDQGNATEAGGINNATPGSDASGTVLGNDTDADGDDRTITAVRTGSESGTGNSGTVGGTLTGAYGTLRLNADGTYTYVVNNSNAAVQALRTSANTLNDTFTYTVSDGHGGTDTAELTITIAGANDAPVAQNDSGSSGNVLSNDTDVDSGDSKTVTAFRAGSESGTGTAGVLGTAFTGQYGTLTLNADGSYTYVADRDNPAVKALAPGQTLSETFTYTLRDTGGLTDTAELTVIVSNDNQAPVAGNDQGNATEAGGINNATPGSDASGTVLGNDTDADGDDRTITAVRTGSESGTGNSGTVGGTLTGSYGTLRLNADGTYTYVVNNSNAAVQALRTSANTLNDTFTYTVSDGHGGTDTAELTITIAGANDAPVAQNDSGSSGNVLTNDTDVDSGDSKTVTAFRSGSESGTGTAGVLGTAFTGQYGTLTLNADGSYTYVADRDNPAVQALAPGQTLSETFTYTLRDTGGLTDTAELTVIVSNDNHAPVAGNDQGNATEAGGINNATPGSDASGTVLGNDTDADGDDRTITAVRTGSESGTGNSGTVGGTLTGAYGTLRLNADGTYTYVVNNSNAAVQALRTSANTLNDTFTYTVSDGHGGTDTAELTITIAGANDAPVAQNDSGSSGNVLTNDTDVDSGDSKTVTAFRSGSESGTGTAGVLGTAFTGQYGALTLNADGSYTYVADRDNPAVKALAPGQTLSETFTYTLRDTGGLTDTAELTVTIAGNELPIANPDTHHVSDTGNADIPADNATGNVVKGSSNTGDRADSDPDGDALTVTAVNSDTALVGKEITGQYGKLTLNQDGTYSYDLDETNADVRALAVGQTLTDTFTYTVSDGHGGTASTTLTVTIDGQDDAPQANPDQNSVTKTADGSPATDATGNVISNGSAGDQADKDADNGDHLTVVKIDGDATKVGSIIKGQYGNLRLNADGSYTYDLDESNPAVQALASGQKLNETFRYTAQDGTGKVAESTLTLTINPVGEGTTPTTPGTTSTTTGVQPTSIPLATDRGGVGTSLDPGGAYIARTVGELQGSQSSTQSVSRAGGAPQIRAAAAPDVNQMLETAPAAAGEKDKQAQKVRADKVKCVPKPTIRHAVAHRATASPFRDVVKPQAQSTSASFTERLKAANVAKDPAKSVIARVQAKRGVVKCN